MYLSIYYLLMFLYGIFTCQQEEVVVQPVSDQLLLFDTIPLAKPLVPMIIETSGIADSKTHANSLWAHEDSGTPTQLMLVGYDGKVKKKVFIKGVQNRDWEEMALSGNDIFLADIGDNLRKFPTYSIYQFKEPAASVDTVKSAKKIEFKYPDGSHDAEAFLVDPKTGDIYIITKRDNPSRIYKITAPYSYTSINTASYVGDLPYTGIVAAALSANGSEVLLKTYTSIYYYTLSNNQSLPEVLQKEGKRLPYQLEPQGEAVAFTHSNSGFYTLSEKGFSTGVNLNFYKRK